ncbi:hypothetical protein HN011_003867, partial [Eciton burchellii]
PFATRGVVATGTMFPWRRTRAFASNTSNVSVGRFAEGRDCKPQRNSPGRAAALIIKQIMTTRGLVEEGRSGVRSLGITRCITVAEGHKREERSLKKRTLRTAIAVRSLRVESRNSGTSQAPLGPNVFGYRALFHFDKGGSERADKGCDECAAPRRCQGICFKGQFYSSLSKEGWSAGREISRVSRTNPLRLPNAMCLEISTCLFTAQPAREGPSRVNCHETEMTNVCRAADLSALVYETDWHLRESTRPVGRDPEHRSASIKRMDPLPFVQFFLDRK